MIVKLADGKPHRMSRRDGEIPDGGRFREEGQTRNVIKTNHAFDWAPARKRDDIRAGATKVTVDQGLSSANKTTVEQGLPHEAVERGLPYGDSTGAVDHNLLHLEDANTLEYVEGAPRRQRTFEVATPPKDARSIIQLPGLSWKHFLRDLKASKFEQICLIIDADSVSPMVNVTSALNDISTRRKSAEPKSARKERFEMQSWEALRESGNPGYETVREFADIFPDKIPAELPADRGVHHEIDLAPNIKYCVTRQWPLPRDHVKAIDDFLENRRQAGHVRKSISLHSSPTFRVKKAIGGWRIVNAFNKLNDANIRAQTPIPRMNMVLASMSGNVIYSAIDLTDGFYQILMRECRSEERPCHI
ncbi:polyprotein [Phytophthora megakarya]|uniref:Polyprotein n=1 Tax=Phytophthora megakarya TaxID=4795 RepID=A0A225W4H8_9STRA|nr:polyprotein [Phytophthora megakarya]